LWLNLKAEFPNNLILQYEIEKTNQFKKNYKSEKNNNKKIVIKFDRIKIYGG